MVAFTSAAAPPSVTEAGVAEVPLYIVDVPLTVTVWPTSDVACWLDMPVSCVLMLVSSLVWFCDCSTWENCASWVTKSVPCAGCVGSWFFSCATSSWRNSSVLTAGAVALEELDDEVVPVSEWVPFTVVVIAVVFLRARSGPAPEKG